MKIPMQKWLMQGAVAALLATSARADYSNSVMTLNPLAYWQLNETTAPPTDNATNVGTLGSAGNGYYAGSAFHPGTGALADGSSHSVVFPDAAGNRVVVPYKAVLGTATPFSVEFWANPGGFQSGDSPTMCIASLTQFGAPPGAGDGTRKGWLFYQNAGTGFTFRTYGSGNTAFNATVNLTLNLGVWYHVVGVYDGANITLYVNGQQAASAAVGSYVPVTPEASPFSVGARGYGALGAFRYNGSVDEVAYYTNVLTAGEILSHYQNGTNPTPAMTYTQLVQAKSPLLYLQFEEPAYVAPDPSTLPVAKNLGSLGTEADGIYLPGTVPGQPGVPYTGVAAPRYGTAFGPNVGGSIDAGSSDSLNFTGPFSIVTWFKAIPDGRFQSFIGKGDTSWRAGIDGSGFARFAFGSNPDVTSTNVLFDNKWHQLAGVYDGTNLVMYIDGLVNSVGSAATAVGGVPGKVSLGTVPDYGDGRVFNGTMDEIALFGSALTAQQVSQLYLVANVPPSIVLQPVASVSADEGTTVTLKSGGYGSPTLSYQWIKNGTNLVGQTTTNLVLSNVGLPDSGSYALVVTNVYGAATSSVAMVTVQTGPPVVLKSPAPLSLYAGRTATFSVLAGGSTPLSYQWLFNGADLSGKTSTNLTIASAQLADAGNYSVRVTNPYGMITSSVVSLTIVAAPTSPYGLAVLSDNPSVYYRLGESNGLVAYDYSSGNNGTYTNVQLGLPGYSITDSNTAAGFGSPAPSYVIGSPNVDFGTNTGVPSFTVEAWVKGGLQAGDVGVITKGTGAGGEQFNLDTGNGGSFRWFIRDAGGGAHLANSAVKPDGDWHYVVGVCDGTAGMLTLYVDGNQAAQTTISGGIKASAQPFTIGCRQTGTTAYDLQWVGTIDEVAIYKTALTGSQISAHYAARYTPNVPPLIRTQPSDLTNYMGLQAKFTVEAGGPGSLSYDWQFEGADIPGGFLPTLTVGPPLQLTDAGNYRVIVTSEFGSVTSMVARLTVLPPPTNLNVSAGLVLHLPFDGNLLDTSGHNNNGTNVGMTEFTDGKIGTNSLHYYTDTASSSYNYVTLGKRPDLSFGSNVNFSVAYWVRLTPGEQSGDLPFFCNAAGSGFSPGYTFAPSYQQGGWSWTLNGTGIYGAMFSINDGFWHHLVHTFDRTGQGITYLDGIQVDTRPISGVGSIDQDAPTNVGQDPNGNYGESGSADIDDIGVWRRVLTPLEAEGIYTAGASNGVTFAQFQVKLTIVHTGNQVQLTWPGGGTLQASSNVSGTYTNVPGATSPFTVTSPTGTKFYRVLVQ